MVIIIVLNLSVEFINILLYLYIYRVFHKWRAKLSEVIVHIQTNYCYLRMHVQKYKAKVLVHLEIWSTHTLKLHYCRELLGEERNRRVEEGICKISPRLIPKSHWFLCTTVNQSEYTERYCSSLRRKKMICILCINGAANGNFQTLNNCIDNAFPPRFFIYRIVFCV